MNSASPASVPCAPASAPSWIVSDRAARPMRRLTVHRESWPLARAFAISRGSRTTAEVVVAEISQGPLKGRGEGVPYGRYGETVDGVVAELEAMAEAVAG